MTRTTSLSVLRCSVLLAPGDKSFADLWDKVYKHFSDVKEASVLILCRFVIEAGWCNLFRCDEKKSYLYKYIKQGTSGLVTVNGEDPGCSIVNKCGERKTMTIDEIKRLNTDTLESFSVFAHDKLPMPGKKKRLEEILDKVISVVDFRITKSNKRENSDCLQIQFVLDNEVYILFTGSVVLIDQIQSVKEKLPFKTTIVKIDKYYSFS